jgi:Flp pilus assembly protein TadD
VARLSLRLPAKIDRHKLLDELTAMKPASYREVISVARALAILTEYRAAEERYQRALQLNPSGAEALVGLAQMMERTGRARQAIDVAGKVQPPTVESLFVLGSAQAATGQKEAACSNFVEAFQQHPSNSNLLSGLGYQFEGCARQELAARAYEASLQVDPNNLQALYNLARLQELSGNSRKAAELYRRFLDLAPASMDAQRRYAQARAGKP